MKYGLVVQDTDKEVPPKNVRVLAQISGFVVALECTLQYKNESADPLEVLFRFPVDESMAVVGLDGYTDGRIIRANVQEKHEAEDTYEDGLTTGAKALLGEESTGDVFSLSLGNLDPGKDAKLVLKLVGELPVDSETGGVRFSLPSVLTQCCTPEGSTYTNGLLTVFGFLLFVSGSEDVSVTSPTHQLCMRRTCGYLQVGLKDPVLWTNDIVVLVHRNNPHQPKAIVENLPDAENEFMASPAVMFDFFPKFESKQGVCELVFLVDPSGSMHWNYINSARETLILFLKSIPPGCYFNVIGLESSCTPLFPASLPYNQSNVDKATEHVQKMQTFLGAPNLLSLLKSILTQEHLAGLPRQLFILTNNGSVHDINSCISEVEQNADRVRVFTFGIGSGASSTLVRGLARAGNGSAQFIKEGERILPKVASALEKALQPSVTDVALRFLVPAWMEVQQTPSKIPPIFNGDRLVVYTVLKTKFKTDSIVECKAVLSGKIGGRDVEHMIEFCFGNGRPWWHFNSPSVHYLAAKSFIKEWEMIERMKTERNETLEGLTEGFQDLENAITTLSIQSGVISRHTAYVAVHKPGPTLSTQSTSTEALSRAEKEDTEETAVGGVAKRFKAADSSTTLSDLLAFQTAEGYWNLYTESPLRMNQSLQAIRDKCPEALVDRVCATALAVSLLRHQFSDQQDEWELVARKAETWMQKQTIPHPHSLNEIIEMAEDLLHFRY